MGEIDPYAPVEANGQASVQAVADADAEPDSNVKRGTMIEVVEWVGNDKNRARAALSVENNSEQPRKRLVAELESILGK